MILGKILWRNFRMSKYITKGMVIEAVQWEGDNLLGVLKFIGLKKVVGIPFPKIVYEAEGRFVTATIGDYIIKDNAGEVCTPSKPEEFNEAYVEVEAKNENESE
jgi:hypothetical protein